MSLTHGVERLCGLARKPCGVTAKLRKPRGPTLGWHRSGVRSTSHLELTPQRPDRSRPGQACHPSGARVMSPGRHLTHMPHQVHTSLSRFTDYVNTPGPKRAEIIEEQFARVMDPTRPAWWPYTAANRIARIAVQSDDPQRALDGMALEVPKGNGWASHYAAIEKGLRDFFGKNRPVWVPVSDDDWCSDELTVRIRNHIGLELTRNRTVVTFMYFKQPPLTSEGAKAGLRILEQCMAVILPGARPAVLDARRGKLHTASGNRNLTRIDRWLRVEAAGYLRYWRDFGNGSAA